VNELHQLHLNQVFKEDAMKSMVKGVFTLMFGALSGQSHQRTTTASACTKPAKGERLRGMP